MGKWGKSSQLYESEIELYEIFPIPPFNFWKKKMKLPLKYALIGVSLSVDFPHLPIQT